MASGQRRMAIIVGVAVGIRLLVLVGSAGTNDVFIWEDMARSVRRLGLMGTYEARWQANHPPLALLYMAGANVVSQATGLPWSWLVKVPGLVGDALIASLIWQVVARRHDLESARRATAIYLLNPLTILLVTFHGNTDMLYVALVFAAVVAFDRQQVALAGALFAAALNVKLIPVIFGAAFLSLLWRRGGWARFAGGFALTSVPLAVVAFQAPALMWDRMLGYRPVSGVWGAVDLGSPLEHPADGILLAVVLVAVAAAAHRYDLGAHRTLGLAGLAFLVFTPSFAPQYLVVAVPFLFVADVRVARVVVWAGGIFLVAAYGNALISLTPATAEFPVGVSHVVSVAGAVAWGVFLWGLVQLLRRPRQAYGVPGRVADTVTEPPPLPEGDPVP